MGNQSSESLRILLVDDEADVRSILKLLLDMEQHDVTEACDGREALDLFNTAQFDLAVTDYVMPGMSGIELAQEFKKQRPKLPVIMITAHADLLPDPVPGVDLLLPKPFKIAALRDAIQRVV
jgi:CheY-like chemotaxis protein